jgi:hypothetical protein
MRNWWTRQTPETRVIYSVALAFWLAIVSLLVIISTGRWP